MQDDIVSVVDINKVIGDWPVALLEKDLEKFVGDITYITYMDMNKTGATIKLNKKNLLNYINYRKVME